MVSVQPLVHSLHYSKDLTGPWPGVSGSGMWNVECLTLGLLNLLFLQSENGFLLRKKDEFIKRPVPFNAILGPLGN